jgi:hypothetical protein
MLDECEEGGKSNIHFDDERFLAWKFASLIFMVCKFRSKLKGERGSLFTITARGKLITFLLNIPYKHNRVSEREKAKKKLSQINSDPHVYLLFFPHSLSFFSTATL